MCAHAHIHLFDVPVLCCDLWAACIAFGLSSVLSVARALYGTVLTRSTPHRRPTQAWRDVGSLRIERPSEPSCQLWCHNHMLSLFIVPRYDRNHTVRKRRMFVGPLNTPYNDRFHVSTMHALARDVDTHTIAF